MWLSLELLISQSHWISESHDSHMTCTCILRALVRPGRFDVHIHIAMPDVKARHNILLVHSKKIKLAPGNNQ